MRVLIFVLILCIVVEGFPQEARKRRIRKTKKVVRTESSSENEQAAPSPASGELKPKSGRGFLDDYYAQFESRVDTSPSEVSQSRSGLLAGSGYGQDQMAMPTRDQMNLPNRDQMVGSPSRDHMAGPSGYNIEAGSPSRDHMTGPSGYNIEVALPSPKGQQGLQATRRQDYQDFQDTDGWFSGENIQGLLSNENQLSAQEKHQLTKQLSSWPNEQLIQQLSLPQNNPDSEAYLYSSVLAEDPRINEVSPSSGFHVPSPDFFRDTVSSPSGVSPFSTGYTAPSGVREVSPFSSLGGVDTTGDERTSASSPSATKYFGITGTTSQDIQLGLTFTVPFLSIPLSNLQSIIGGEGLGDIGNFFNFESIDTTTIVTLGAIALGAIFILPQAIYWLTGINLSAFNWARSDEDGNRLVSLANSVDSALQEFGIDSRNCLGRTLCTSLQDQESKEGDSPAFLSRILDFAASNPAVHSYMGHSQMELAKEAAASGQQCGKVFTSRCPWDPAAMTQIMFKFMANSDMNLADIALKAAAAMAKS